MGRVFAEYIDKLYMPARSALDDLTRENYASLRLALQTTQELQGYWERITINHLATSVDKKEVVSEGERITVTCEVRLNGAPPELFTVELFCVLHEQNERRVIPMRPRDTGVYPMVFECELDMAGRGLFSVNARIKPASPILQDLYPELVKWAE
jgi:hypothetical protein